MGDQDFDNMSLADLRDLRGKVDRAINGFNDRRRREAVAAAEDAVRKLGFASLSEVTRRQRGKGAARSSASPAPGRYVNPEDPSQTWSGRGRRPAWLVEGINSGKSLEDFAV